MKSPYIYRGETIQCPQCRVQLYTFTRDCYVGEMLAEDMLVAMKGIKPPKNGDTTACVECRAGYYNLGKVHLKTGWTK